MPQQKTAYRPTPTNPNTPAATPPVREQHAVDLDDFMDEIDELLSQEEEFAIHYRARGGE